MLSRLLEAALRAPSGQRDAAVDDAVEALGRVPRDELPTASAADHLFAIEQRRAFWINAYNVLTLHSVRGRGASLLSAWHRCAFVRYRVAEEALTLDQIEHGLLRDNARPPYRLRRTFGEEQPALAWGVPLDPRIHFALNCGATSCPPVRVYTADALDAQLDLAERAFLGSETRIDDTARIVTTSELLDFYAGDFGGTDGVLARIERAFDRPPRWLHAYRLLFDKYDWGARIRFAQD